MIPSDQAGVAPPEGVHVVEAPVSDRVRSPVDVLRLLTATVMVVLVVVVEWLFGNTLEAFAAELFAGLAAVPGWLVDVVVAGSRLLAVGLLVTGVVVVVRGGHARPVLPLVVAAVVAAALASLLDITEPASAGAALDAGGPVGPLADAGFPTAAGLAAAAAATTAAAPWLARGWRQLCWTAVFGLATVLFLATPASFDPLEAVLLGWLAGAAAVVVFGGPSRRPRGGAVVAGLAAVGVPVVRLEQASVDARGSTPYFGETADGERLFVKTLGDDERSADRLFRLYRRVVPRDLGDEQSFSSLRRAVEHEALVALAALAYGVRTPRLVALAPAEPNGFVLAYEAVDGSSLDRLTPDEVTDDVLGAVWSEVVQLRSHRVAHRDLRLANIFLAADGEAWLIDFGFSELVASDLLLSTDLAELVASSALQVGSERAVARAADAVGEDTLRTALPRLHPWALSGATRTALKGRPGLLDDVRARITAA